MTSDLEKEQRKQLQQELDQLGVALDSVKDMTLPNDFHRKIVSLFENELSDIKEFAESNNLT